MAWRAVIFLILGLAVPAAQAKDAGNASPSPAPASSRISLSGVVYVGGMRSLTAEVKAVADAGGYRVEGSSRTEGLVDLIAKWRGEFESVGARNEGGLQPVVYRYQGQSRWGDKQLTISYSPGQPPAVDLVEDRKKASPYDEREDLNRDSTIGAADIVSSVFQGILSSAMAPANVCDVTYPVFDGKRRYDVHLKQVGEDFLKPNRYSAFSGKAQKCRVTVTRIGGFSKKGRTEEAEALANGAEEEEAHIWLARFGPERFAIPVRMEAKNYLGWAIYHPTRILIDDKTVIAMRNN